jgi:hypothetical protein
MRRTSWRINNVTAVSLTGLTSHLFTNHVKGSGRRLPANLTQSMQIKRYLGTTPPGPSRKGTSIPSAGPDRDATVLTVAACRNMLGSTCQCCLTTEIAIRWWQLRRDDVVVSRHKATLWSSSNKDSRPALQLWGLTFSLEFHLIGLPARIAFAQLFASSWALKHCCLSGQKLRRTYDVIQHLFPNPRISHSGVGARSHPLKARLSPVTGGYTQLFAEMNSTPKVPPSRKKPTLASCGMRILNRSSSPLS